MPSPPNDGEDQGASPVNGPSVGSYQSSGKRKVHSKKKKGTITANVAGTKYEIVRTAISEMDFIKARDDDETANLIWNDSAVQHEKIAELRNYQRINHFPGMGEICRKDCLARNMSKIIKCQPQEYSFIPKTWIFPAEYTQFQNYVKELRRKRKQKTFIVKPANGAMGHGYVRGQQVSQSDLYTLTDKGARGKREKIERKEGGSKLAAEQIEDKRNKNKGIRGL